MYKSFLSRLFQSLFLGFQMSVVDDAGGGAAEDRGDTIADSVKVVDTTAVADPMKDGKDDKASKDDKAGADESEEEDEEEEEGEEDSEGKDDAAKTKKDTRIPLARHKAMIDKARAERDSAVAQLAKYTQGEAIGRVNDKIAADETKLVALEAEYNKFLIDGDIDKATAKMSEVRKLERSITQERTNMAAEIASANAVEQVRFEAVLGRIEAAYPVVNPDHDLFDQAVANKVLRLKRGFELQGAPSSAALQEAVDTLLGATTTKQEQATTVTPRVAKEDVEKQRKAEALKRNVEASKAAAPSTASVGLNSDEKGGQVTAEAVKTMKQSEFAKLTDSELARLRGDEI